MMNKKPRLEFIIMVLRIISRFKYHLSRDRHKYSAGLIFENYIQSKYFSTNAKIWIEFEILLIWVLLV